VSDRVPLSPSIIADRLSRSEIFGALSRSDLTAIAAFCSEEHYPEGAQVFPEDGEADKLVIVERGRLALEKKIQLGRHSTPRNATIGYVDPGKAAGFSAVSPPHFYSTSAVCVEPTRAIVVDGLALRAYLDEHPEAGLKVMSTLSELISGRYRDAINTLTYFLSVVSHELRSPLAAIEGYLQNMLGGFVGELTPKQEATLKRSVLRVIELRAQIGDVVDLARMRPEQIQADFEWFDPGEIATESVEDVRLAAAEKEIRIKVEPPRRFEPIVGARRRMRQMLTNLLNNAIRYSPRGGTVIFRARYEPDAMLFEVEDQGPGIPPDELSHIFKDFYRASNVSEAGGMGLGLSIARKIVDAHGGEILVENLGCDENPTGAHFTVIIPRNLMTPEMRRREWLAEDSQQT
jgi:signal transduction histidine kinase